MKIKETLTKISNWFEEHVIKIFFGLLLVNGLIVLSPIFVKQFKVLDNFLDYVYYVALDMFCISLGILIWFILFKIVNKLYQKIS